MFLCVWLYFKKFSEKYFLVFEKCYKEKYKTRKTNTAPRLTLDARLGSTVWCFASSNPTTALSIAILRSTAPLRKIAISRSVECDLAKHRADRDRRTGEFAISRSVNRNRREGEITISRSTAPIDIGAKASSRSRIAIDGAGACERRRLELGACKRHRLVMLLPLALSLSLSEIHLKWK